MKIPRFLSRLFTIWLVASLLAGCAKPGNTSLATPMPAAFLPTAVALTLAASGVGASLPTSTPPAMQPAVGTVLPTTLEPALAITTTSAVQATATPTLTATLATTPSATAPVENTAVASPEVISTMVITTSVFRQATPTLQVPLPGTSQVTPAPEIPDARVQIYQLGERSLVTSPILITARLTSQTGKVVRVELFGEDGSLLARHVRTFNSIPWLEVKIGVNLDFEIRATAEEGRLVVSVEDPYGRLIDVNSVNLILLSQGVTQLNPATALWQRIIIQEPAPKGLIQGGTLIVSGRAKPNTTQPLKVELIGEDGKILGQRLASLTMPIPGDYGTFIAEVPYNVTGMTPALLVVFEDDGKLSAIAHLASQQVVLAP